MKFDFISINVPNTDDLRGKVWSLLEGTRQLMTDLEAFSFGFEMDKVDVSLDDLNSRPGAYASLVSTHIRYYGRSFGCLTWRYNFQTEQWYIISLEEYDNLFNNWAKDVGYCSRPVVEVALRHILAGRFLLPRL